MSIFDAANARVVRELFAQHQRVERARRWGDISQVERDGLVLTDNNLLELMIGYEDLGVPGATEALARWADEVLPY